jgi:galactokinase
MNRWTVATFSDRDAVAERLVQFGMSVEAAEAKVVLFQQVAGRLVDQGISPDQAATAFFVPGRIEVLGKHTDYAGGRSLLVAVERGFCAVAVERRDATIRVFDVAANRDTAFPFAGEIQPTVGDWTNYPQTVARRIARNFSGPLHGAHMAFQSDLPLAAGMSSSSALMVTTYLLLATMNQLDSRAEYRENIHRLEDLAGYLGTIENGLSFGGLAGDRGVGTFGGSEDHTAILSARPGMMIQYAYCPVRFERAVTLPKDQVFVVAVSGVVADKTGAAMGKYNRVSQLARAILDLWSQETGHDAPHLAAMIASSKDAVERIRDILSKTVHEGYSTSELMDRFEHFLTESNEIIPAVPDPVDKDLDQFKDLVARSQSRGARLLRNQTPETIWLAEHARSIDATAASAFGAGFGGSVWALVPAAHAEKFRLRWEQDYRQAFPGAARNATFFLTHAGPPACRLDTTAEH